MHACLKLMIYNHAQTLFDKILNINVMIIVSFEFQVFTPKLGCKLYMLYGIESYTMLPGEPSIILEEDKFDYTCWGRGEGEGEDLPSINRPADTQAATRNMTITLR